MCDGGRRSGTEAVPRPVSGGSSSSGSGDDQVALASWSVSSWGRCSPKKRWTAFISVQKLPLSLLP